MIWILLIAGAATSPYTFQAYWPRRWFKIVWGATMLFAIAGAMNQCSRP
jgi:hypothetical protein